MSVLARELVASGDVYNSGYGYSRLNRLVKTGKMPAKIIEGKLKKPVVLIRTLSGHYLTEKYVATTVA